MHAYILYFWPSMLTSSVWLTYVVLWMCKIIIWWDWYLNLYACWPLSLLSLSHTHTHTCTCTHSYMHAHMHIQAHTHTHTHAHTHTHTHTNGPAQMKGVAIASCGFCYYALGSTLQSYFQPGHCSNTNQTKQTVLTSIFNIYLVKSCGQLMVMCVYRTFLHFHCNLGEKSTYCNAIEHFIFKAWKKSEKISCVLTGEVISWSADIPDVFPFKILWITELGMHGFFSFGGWIVL